MLRVLTILILLCALSYPSFSQEGNNQKLMDASFALKLNLALGGGQSSWYNLSFSAALSRDFKHKNFHGIPAVQTSINFYSKGLGTSIFPQNRKMHLDIVNSFIAAGGYKVNQWKDNHFQIRPFSQTTASNIHMNLDFAVYYGTSFIINNHQRNQQIGNMGLLLKGLNIGYYNDGFYPFRKIASDGFDRYWTGGGYIALKFDLFGAVDKKWFEDNWIELAYDRFTGDVQDAYEFSKALFLYGIPAKNEANEEWQTDFNRALTGIYIRNRWGSHIGVSLLGQCPCDFQDWSHDKLGNSRHISYDDCSVLFSGGFQKNFNFQLIEK